jgi:hypothetical protein
VENPYIDAGKNTLWIVCVRSYVVMRIRFGTLEGITPRFCLEEGSSFILSEAIGFEKAQFATSPHRDILENVADSQQITTAKIRCIGRFISGL